MSRAVKITEIHRRFFGPLRPALSLFLPYALPPLIGLAGNTLSALTTSVTGEKVQLRQRKGCKQLSSSLSVSSVELGAGPGGLLVDGTPTHPGRAKLAQHREAVHQSRWAMEVDRLRLRLR
jgi:hypothetical protein